MADNVAITAGAGTNIATDEVSSVHYQKIKLDAGGDGASAPVYAGVGAAANALRVALASSSEIIANLSATDNAVLDAIQTAIEACQTALEGTLTADVTGQGDVPITLDGEAITANLGATDNAVLDAIQVAVEAIQTAIEGTVTVDGTVTANLGATDNAVLDAIQTAIEAVQTAVEGTLTADVTGQGDVPITLDGEAITANLGATDNAVLDAIQAAAEAIQTAVEGTLTADVTGQGDVPVTLDSEVVAVDATGQGDVPVTLDSEAVVLGAGSAAIGKLAANSGVDIGDVDVTSISAGENHLGQVGMDDDVITITISLDTSAYADGDVLFATQEIASAVRNNGDSCILQSIQISDIDDQGEEMDLIFFNAATSLGTENSAPDIDDTEVLTVLGKVNISADDYIDLGANQIATLTGIGLVLEAGGSTTSLYVAGITRGTPTHTASGLQIMFGFLRN